MRRLRNLCIFALVVCLLLAACGGGEPSSVYTDPTEETQNPQDLGTLTILFTGDLQNVFARDTVRGEIGYAALAKYRDQLEDDGNAVILIDGGGAFANADAGAVKDGKTLTELIGAVGYGIRVPGIEELSFGVENFLSLADEMEDCTYISCNLLDSNGETVFDPYVIVECGTVKVGFVGITTPHAAEILTEEGYDFCQGTTKQDFFDAVQDAIDAASDAGADYVIAVGSLGIDPMDTPWTSAEVIANTTGLAAFLDSGSGSVLEGNTVKNLDNYEIPVCAAGSEFAYVGQITLNLNDGTAEITLLTTLEKEDKDIAQQAADLLDVLEKE